MNKRRPFTTILERVVFGAMIAISLLLLGGLVVPAVNGYWRTRGETTVVARLLEVESRTRSGRRGSTSETLVNYEYEVDGRQWRGGRVSLFAVSGPFYPELSGAHRDGRGIRIYIDARDPSYSVYHREFTWWPLSLAVVMATGFGVMGMHGLYWCWKNPKRG